MNLSNLPPILTQALSYLWVLYIIGFVVINSYLDVYSIQSYDFINISYVKAAIVFCISYLPIFLISKFSKFQVDEKNFLSRPSLLKLSYVSVFLAATTLLLFRTPIDDSGNLLLYSTYGAGVFLLVALFTSDKWPFVKGILSIVYITVAVSYLIDQASGVPYLTYILSSLFWLVIFDKVLNDSSDLSISDLLLSAFFFLITLISFGKLIYPSIEPSLGGSVSDKQIITLTSDVGLDNYLLKNDSTDENYKLIIEFIYQDDTYIYGKKDSFVFGIRKEYIKVIQPASSN